MNAIVGRFPSFYSTSTRELAKDVGSFQKKPQTKDLLALIDKIDSLIKKCFESHKENIEDLADQLACINELCRFVIQNKLFDLHDVSNVVDLRKHIYKRTIEKYKTTKEAKATLHYKEFEQLWQKSSNTMRDLLEQRKCNDNNVINDTTRIFDSS